MIRTKPHLIGVIAFSCIAVLSSNRLNAKPPDVRFFIDTEIEWQPMRDGSPQQFKTARGQIYGHTQIIGVYGGGKLALLSGYVHYDPKTMAFQFAPSEGFAVYLGKWEKAEDGHLKVEYRFAQGDKLACPLGAKSYDDCYGFRYKEPSITATWSAACRADGSIASIEAPQKDAEHPMHYVPLSKLTNQLEVMEMLRYAEKLLSEHLKSPS